MAIYFLLLLAAPTADPVVAQEIRAKPVPLWEISKGLVDDRPTLGYALPPQGEQAQGEPRLGYDVADMGKWDEMTRRDEAAFEEAVEMAKEARQRIEGEDPFRR